MKKLLFVFAIAAFAACGSGAGDTTGKDTTNKDTTMPAATPAPDTTGTAQRVADSLAMAKKADSLHQDSVKKKLIK